MSQGVWEKALIWFKSQYMKADWFICSLTRGSDSHHGFRSCSAYRWGHPCGNRKELGLSVHISTHAWKKYFVLLLWLKGPTNQAISKTKVVFIIPDTRLFIFLECITVNSREPSRFPSCGHGSPESSAGGLSLKHFLGVCSNQGIEHTSYSFKEGNGTPLQYSCLENPMDGGA